LNLPVVGKLPTIGRGAIDMDSSETAPIRSFLFTPANHPRRVEKVFQVGADAVILDLEDAVAISEKPAARQDVVNAFSSRPNSATRHYVRVNSIDTPYCEDDIKATVGPWLDGVVLPKVESRACLNELERMLAAAEAEQGIPVGSLDLMPIIETARGVESAKKIATADSRVKRMAFGGGDYTLDLNYQWEADETVLAYARAKLSHASRLGDLEPPIDTVVLQIKDNERFLQSARQGKQFGFGGKLCIHPDQISLTHEVFTPSEAEIAHARAVVAAFEAAEAEGSASIQLDGYFIDYPIVYKSQRILALADKLLD
jgi:citrate lyase subunit beta/citryl-CoA lyase